MDKQYWEDYYSKHTTPFAPSPFSEFALEWIEKDSTLLELGCGNARDSLFFSKNGIIVTAVDQAENEIAHLQKTYAIERISFVNDDFTAIKKVTNSFDYIYSRFTIHSINYKQEQRTLNWINSHLNDNGLFLLEVRSIKDELFQAGTTVEDENNAKITDHYRRFIKFDRLKQDITNLGLDIIFSIEAQGLAPYKNEDPVVIRIIAKKSINQ